MNTKAKKYFSYDGESEIALHETPEEASASAQSFLTRLAEIAADDYWSEQVDEICWGEIKGRVFQARFIKREDCSIDENGWDEENKIDWHDDWTYFADYQLREV